VAAADLTLVTDRRRLAGRSLPSLAADAARAGVEWIQVREKDLQARALLQLVEEIADVLAGTGARLMVNGRPDVAEAGGADGVQLPEDGLPVAAVKKAFPGLVVSASRHTVEGARRAEAEGADLLLIGPVFPTPGKPAALGIEGFEEIAGSVSIPAHAIGGMEPATARRVVDAGAVGLAAIRAFLTAPPAETVRAFRDSLR
jgi:thiamine-phosphate pyrophosphorylase